MARRRKKIAIDALQLTGGGKLTEKPDRIINGPLYKDVAMKLGISSIGHAPRFDSDSIDTSTIEPASKRSKIRETLSKPGCSTSHKMASKTSVNVHSDNTNPMLETATHSDTNVANMEHSDQLQEHLNGLEMKLLQSQLDEIVTQKEKLRMLEKAQALVDDEVKHKIAMMKLAEEAERLKVERSKPT